MDDTTSNEARPADRRQRFEADLAEVRVRTGTNAGEGRLVATGVAMMAIGLVITIVSFVVSGGQADTRDVLSSLIMAVFGLSLCVVGGVVFVRYSFARFLRFWMLRLLYEQAAD